MSLRSLLTPPDDTEDTVGIWYVRRRLGRTDYKEKRIVTYVTLLVTEAGFPPPLPCMHANRLERGVTRDSQWRRNSVDAWLDDFLPPDNAMSMDRAARATAAADMDAAAAALGNLRLINGGRL